jgi:hypothetical protein
MHLLCLCKGDAYRYRVFVGMPCRSVAYGSSLFDFSAQLDGKSSRTSLHLVNTWFWKGIIEYRDLLRLKQSIVTRFTLSGRSSLAVAAQEVRRWIDGRSASIYTVAHSKLLLLPDLLATPSDTHDDPHARTPRPLCSTRLRTVCRCHARLRSVRWPGLDWKRDMRCAK